MQNIKKCANIEKLVLLCDYDTTRARTRIVDLVVMYYNRLKFFFWRFLMFLSKY